ncbi:MAG: PAS domain S-box protein, partial [Bacteroidales bacterium]|nr:PAS domain S-box protein [Bacteroidales bacterium]
EVAEKKHKDELLFVQSAQLAERIKELECLYKLTSLSKDGNLSAAEFFQKAVCLIPPAWQLPSACSAVLNLDNQTYTSKPEKDRKNSIQEYIRTSQKVYGSIEVFYSDANLKFLEEEKILLKTISDIFLQYIISQEVNHEKKQIQALFETLFQESPLPVSIYKEDGGEINMVNKAWEDFYGLQAQDVVGKTVVEAGLIDKDNFKKLYLYFKESGEIASHETTTRIASGEIKEVISSVKTIQFNNQTFILNVLVDISDKKQDERLIREQQENLRITLDSIGDGVITTDTEGRITRLNPVAQLLTGYTDIEAIGKPLTDVFRIFHAITGQKAINPVLRVLKEGIVVGLANHTKLISKNGQKYHIADSAAPIRDANGQMQGVVMVFRDVSKEYEMREKIEASESMYRAIFENTGTASSLIEADGTIVVANQRFSLLAEQPLSEIEKKRKWTEFVVQEDLNRMLEQHKLRRQNREKALREYYFRFLTVNKEIRHIFLTVDMIPGTTMSIASLQDITDLKNNEEALRNSELRFRSFVENANDIVYSVSPEGFFTYVSPNWEEQIGEPAEAAIGKSISEYVHPEDVHLCFDFLKKVLESGEKQSGVEYRVKHNDGSFRWHASNGSMFKDDNGIPLFYMGIARDITQTKTAQEALISNEKKLRNILDNSADAVFITNSEGYFNYVNQEATSLLGWSEHELLNMQIVDITPIGWRQKRMEQFQLLLEKGNILIEVDLLKADGSTIEVELNATVLPDGNVFGSCRDISERKKQQLQIQFNEQRYRNLVNEMQIGLALHEMLFDENGKPVDYRFLDVNSAFLQLTGLSYDIIGKTVLEILPGTETSWIGRYGEVVLTGEPISFENYSSVLNHHYAVRAYKHSENQFAVLVEDITKRKQISEEISEQRRQLTTLFDNLPGLAYRCKNDEFYTMEFLSKGCIDLTGYVSDDLINNRQKSYFSLIYPDDKDYVRTKINEKLAQDQPFEIEYRIVKKNGEIRWVWEKGRKVSVSEEGVEVLEGLINDITDRKEMEINLQDALARNQAHKIANPDMLFIFNSEGVIVDFNAPKSVEQFLLMPPDQFLGKSIRAVVPPHIAELTLKKVDEVLSTGNPAASEYSLDIGGQTQYFEARYVKGGQEEVLAIVRNDTEKILAKKALAASEEKFRNLFQKHSAIKLIIKPSTGEIIEANDAAAAYYGWSVEELCRMKISEINTMNTWQVKKEMIRARDQENVHFLFNHRKSDGTTADVEVFSSKITIDGVDYLHSIVHDVTEKIKAEEKLRLLSRSVEQNPVSIVITNSTGIIEYVNPAFSRITGYSLEEAVGQNPRILKSGHHSQKFYKNLWATILSGSDWRGELLNVTKEGLEYWEDVVISPIVNDGGKITHFVAVKEDISSKKKMIQDLTLAKEKAEESDRLKSAFLANMSHEIRTPMNGIIGFTGLLKDSDLTGEERSQFIDIIQRSGQRMLNTVNDLIDISKIETGQMPVIYSEFDIFEKTESLFQFFLLEASDKGISLKFDYNLKPNCRIIRSDEVKIDSIFSNLIKNAIKYTDEGFITISLNSKGKSIEFSVTDTGIGIPKERQGAVFNRFEQADVADKRAYQGSGLGLTITKAYVEMLGGTISLESELGKGSKFTVFFPEIDYCETDEKDDNSFTQEHEKSNKIGTILIAEDDYNSYLYLTSVLRKQNLRILSAQTGVEAVDICRRNPDIALILMDIKMPEMDGYDATKEIRTFNTDIVIIAQTAYALEGDRKKALDAGCNDYLAKPISIENLIDLIANYL